MRQGQWSDDLDDDCLAGLQTYEMGDQQPITHESSYAGGHWFITILELILTPIVWPILKIMKWRRQ